jgi:hypothetical protein
MYAESNTETESWKNFYPGKVIRVSVGICSSNHLNAKPMHRFLLSYVAYLSVAYFITLFHRRNEFWKALISIKCVYRISLLESSEIFLILKRNGRNMFINIHSCKQTFKLILKYFNGFEFSEKFYRWFPSIKCNEILCVVAE